MSLAESVAVVLVEGRFFRADRPLPSWCIRKIQHNPAVGFRGGKNFVVDSLAVSNILHPGQCAVLHQEFFRFHAPLAAHKVVICLHRDQKTTRQTLAIELNPQKNKYRFPIRKPCFVTGCYIDADAHRWCQNSEFAIDIGFQAPHGMLDADAILGEPVYAAADGIILRAVECVGDGGTDPAVFEQLYGNDVRIDGNHIILEHAGGECSLYAPCSNFPNHGNMGNPSGVERC